MKKISKMLFSIFIFLTFFISTGTSVFGATIDEVDKENIVSTTGIVQEITYPKDSDGKTIPNAMILHVKSNDGWLTNFSVDNNTLITNGIQVKVGSKVTAYYDKTQIVLTVYPTTYHALKVDVLPSESENGENNNNTNLNYYLVCYNGNYYYYPATYIIPCNTITYTLVTQCN